MKSKVLTTLKRRIAAFNQPAENTPEQDALKAFLISTSAAVSGHRVLTEMTQKQQKTAVSALSFGPDFAANIIDITTKALLKKKPEEVRNIGYSLIGSDLTSELGYLVLGKAAVWRRLWDFATDSFSQCTPESISKHAANDALRAFSEAQMEDKARDILACLNTDDMVFDAYSNAALHEIGSYAAYYNDREVFNLIHTALDLRTMSEPERQQWDNLHCEFAAQQDVGKSLGVFSYSEIRDALVWKLQNEDPVVPSDKITLGYLNYRNPTRPSSNIGDHVQTIAALGQLQSFDFEHLEATPAVRSVVERNEKDEKIGVDAAVEIIPVDRDFTILQDANPHIWLPVCGWFAHPIYKLNLGLPFAQNITPIFMSFHVNNFDVFTPETIEYLRVHEPIGCRDYLTVRTLREQGIAAFFNGCVTLTIGDVYKTATDEARHGRYYGAYNAKNTPNGYDAIVHLDRDMWTKTFDENIIVADEMLQKYQFAEDVTTPLLHCLLPCRAMGTPVTFTNPKEGDPRFHGLVDANDAMREATAERFRVKYKAVMSAILAGGSKEEVYAVWTEACAPDIERTTKLLADEGFASPLHAPFDITTVAEDIRNARYDIGNIADLAPDAVELLFAFDAGYLTHFLTVMQSILRNTTRPIHAYLFVRGIKENVIEDALTQFQNITATIYDLTKISYGDVNLMDHISVSTMDRLMAPEILDQCDKIVYLDVDILVRHDIGTLFDMEFDTFSLAGRSGIDKRWSEGRLFAYEIPKKMRAQDATEFRSRLFDTGQTDFKNFNAGVLWMNLDKLRAEAMSNVTIGWSTRFGLNDQYALNLFTRGNRGELPAAWNHYVIQEFNSDPAIVHYIGPVKPWSPGAVLPFLQEWQQHQTAVKKTWSSNVTDGFVA